MTDDKYKSFAELKRVEREGADFGIRIERRPSPVAIIAPHGGEIEPGTSELTIAIASDRYSYYCFEGRKRAGNRDLHITSARFDEPQALALVAAADYVVAIHGWRNTERLAYLGGLDVQMRARLEQSLNQSGFATATSGFDHLSGTNPANICNRGRRRMGVQLELSRGLRNELRDAINTGPRAPFIEFVAAVQRGIANTLGH